MKVLNKVVIGMAALTLLTACGAKKVEYSKFHEQAVEAAKAENGYTKVTVNGKAKMKEDGKVTEYTFDKIEIDGFTNGRMDALTAASKMAALLLDGSEVKIIAFSLSQATAEIVPEDKDSTYYVGGFQVDSKDGEQKSTVKFDKNGLPTSYKYSGEGSGSITLSWSK